MLSSIEEHGEIKKPFLGDKCKETEENNKMVKTDFYQGNWKYFMQKLAWKVQKL